MKRKIYLLKDNPQNERKFLLSISYKVLISKIYKVFTKLNNRMSTVKTRKRIDRYFP